MAKVADQSAKMASMDSVSVVSLRVVISVTVNFVSHPTFNKGFVFLCLVLNSLLEGHPHNGAEGHRL